MHILLLLLLLLPSLQVTAAQITVKVDRNPVNLNESFQLTYIATETPDGNPDFEPLQQDFEVLNQRHSNQMTLVNGKRSTSIQWTVQLMAKQAGSLVVPAIHFGKDKTEPMTIMVAQSASHQDIDSNQELLLKVDATPLDPYVQSQVLYTLRLFRRVNIAQARLDDPTLADAVVQKLGEDSNYNTQINGIDYVVTERNYAIFPQKSGKVTIPPLALTAEVVSGNNSRFGGFFNSPATRTQRIASKAISLNVRPAPVDLKMPHWLPTEEVVLKQEWSGDTDKMKVGEPLTRTLIVFAQGATVGLLPELATQSPDPKLKFYPDQPTLKELPKAEGLYALREEKIAIIPSSAGTFTLPAIEVPWFNTKTQKVEVAKIPATILTVLAAPQNSTAAPAPATISSPAIAPLSPTPQVVALAEKTIPWKWIALFLGAGWLSTLLYFLTRRPAPKIEPEVVKSTPSQTAIAKTLKHACQHNDMQQAKQVLLEWGLAEFDVTSLGALADCCDARLRDEIQLLNQLLYAQQNDATTAQQWRGKRLFQMFSEQQAAQKLQENTKDDKLEPLHRL